MLHELPVRNVRLSPCSVRLYPLPSAPGSHYYGHCQRVVHDFTQTKLTAARAAARLQFRAKCRPFLMVALLVMVQGLSGQEARAQVRRSTRPTIAQPVRSRNTPAADVQALPDRLTTFEGRPIYTHVDHMPVYRAGGWEGLKHDLASQVRRPAGRAAVTGRVFVRAVIDREGNLRNPRIVKGLQPEFDQEALRVVQCLPAFVPARQNGQAVDVEFTFPIDFPAD